MGVPNCEGAPRDSSYNQLASVVRTLFTVSAFFRLWPPPFHPPRDISTVSKSPATVNMLHRQPFHGTSRRFVLAMDVGTTFSGMSYSILDPEEIPKILHVRRYPGQEDSAGDSKIPSIIYYDRNGLLRAVGAEAQLPHIINAAVDEGWVKTEWFKLLLRPKSMAPVDADAKYQRITRLPPNKSIIDVLADLIGYLFACARKYVAETHASGGLLWESVEADIDFVFSHPNGWGGAQQDKMRQAIVLAGLIPDTEEGHGRIQFVTEGEASIHFCMSNGLATDAVKRGMDVMVVDAGGGTIDISTYAINNENGLKLEELTAPECALEGSTVVSFRARSFLTAKLSGSLFADPDEIQEIVQGFDKKTKHTFKNPYEASYIKFGGTRDHDPDYGIKNGQLTLSGNEVASIFEPSITTIKTMIQNQQTVAAGRVSVVFLVGGFAASPWLFSQLKSFTRALGIDLSRPDTHTNKAVAEGALSSYLDRFVSARIARVTYGVQCAVRFDPSDPEHARRSLKAVSRSSGDKCLPGGFFTILNKETRVSEEKEFTRTFNMESKGSSTNHIISTEILCYRGTSLCPRWIDQEPHMFSTLCVVKADISRVPRIPLLGPKSTYHSQDFKVVLLFGLTELKAQISWIEGGEERRSPATTVYDDCLIAS